MPTSLPFHLIDVFSPTPYKGNPLAIVDARTHPSLTTTQMQLITRQFNLSETTFLFPPSLPNAHFKLRSFLPYGWEVFGAGHNILGVWWFLGQEGVLELGERKEEREFGMELGEKVGSVKVGRTDKGGVEVVMRQAPPGAHVVGSDLGKIAEVLGLEAGEVGFEGREEMLPRVMSTATTHHLLVPVRSVEALNRAVVDRGKLVEVLDSLDKTAHGIYWFAEVEGVDGVPTFQARFYSRGMTSEDPATGSAAGPLSAYLYRGGVLKLDEEGKARILVYQGLKLGRECVIEVRLGSRNVSGEEMLDVDVVGTGALVAKGEIELPGLGTEF